jgi:diguanylate cyclase (GGDEF)-like protein
MDLDGFKETNDVYGHGTGDVLLAEVSARLQMKVGGNHTLARVGGDEFAVAIASDQSEAVAVAESILMAFACPFAVGTYRVSLGISIGIASNDTLVDADELVRRADTAMYVAKSRGKHGLQIYDPGLDAGRERRRKMETDLRTAIEEETISVVFQNIVCARTRVVIGVEALARWHHPVLGQVSPDQFIPIAEASGLIVQLGRQILLAACEQARSWGVDLAVNLSPAQFWDRDLADTIREVLRTTGFPAERLELEITEGYLMRRPEAAREILGQLKAMGVRISLDDFGTGYASIGYLQQLGFDGIKIDKSFIAASLTDPKAADLARAIIAIGDALEVPVTAEGVETPPQAALMQAAGCKRLQGWLFGRPATADQMSSQFLDRKRLAS